MRTTVLDEILVRGTVYDGDEKTLLTCSRVEQEKPKRSTEIYKILEFIKTYLFVSETQGKKATGAF